MSVEKTAHPTKAAASALVIKRNLNDTRFCPVFNLARWLAILAENGVERGPLFPLTIEGRVSDPLEEMTPGQWGAWIQKVFVRAGGVRNTLISVTATEIDPVNR